MKHLSYLWPNQKILTLLQVSFRNVLEGTFALELKINLLRAIFFKKKKKKLDNIICNTSVLYKPNTCVNVPSISRKQLCKVVQCDIIVL